MTHKVKPAAVPISVSGSGASGTLTLLSPAASRRPSASSPTAAVSPPGAPLPFCLWSGLFPRPLPRLSSSLGCQSKHVRPLPYVFIHASPPRPHHPPVLPAFPQPPLSPAWSTVHLLPCRARIVCGLHFFRVLLLFTIGHIFYRTRSPPPLPLPAPLSWKVWDGEDHARRCFCCGSPGRKVHVGLFAGERVVGQRRT